MGKFILRGIKVITNFIKSLGYWFSFNMKAYMNKFRAPRIHKVPAPKPNEGKQEES